MGVPVEAAGVTDTGAEGSAGTRVLRRPSPEEAAVAAASALREGRVASLVGRWEVGGRDDGASGDRLVLLKPDGSIVVHGADGTAPESRLKGIGADGVTAMDDAVRIEVEGGPTIRVVDVRFVTVAALGGGSDGGRTRHAAIRERLLADPERIEPGYRPLATERETSAGPVDLYGRDAEGRHVVVEIKGERAGPAAVGQLDRYVEALDRDLHAGAEVRGILVAPSATERTRRLLEERGYGFQRIDVGE